MSYIYDNNQTKPVRIHKRVSKDLEELDPFTKRKLLELFSLLSAGQNIGMPLSRPMPVVANGAHELRLKDSNGQYRVFYFSKAKDAVLVFHFFKKKTQTTPRHEIVVAQLRLKEML